MSDSVSISFVREPRKDIMGAFEREESVTIYTTWGGKALVKIASDFIGSLDEATSGDPVTRREPDALVGPFISMLSDEVVESMRVLPTECRLKHTVNGHWQIDACTGKTKKIMEAEKHG